MACKQEAPLRRAEVALAGQRTRRSVCEDNSCDPTGRQINEMSDMSPQLRVGTVRLHCRLIDQCWRLTPVRSKGSGPRCKSNRQLHGQETAPLEAAPLVVVSSLRGELDNQRGRRRSASSANGSTGAFDSRVPPDSEKPTDLHPSGCRNDTCSGQ